MSFGTIGVGFGAGAGGGSSGILMTGVWPVPPGTPRPVPAGLGKIMLSRPITEPLVQGGTGEATMPGVGGTRVGSEVLDIISVRIDSVGARSDAGVGRS